MSDPLCALVSVRSRLPDPGQIVLWWSLPICAAPQLGTRESLGPLLGFFSHWSQVPSGEGFVGEAIGTKTTRGLSAPGLGEDLIEAYASSEAEDGSWQTLAFPIDADTFQALLDARAESDVEGLVERVRLRTRSGIVLSFELIRSYSMHLTLQLGPAGPSS